MNGSMTVIDRYREVSKDLGAIVPSDKTMAALFGVTTSASASARGKLRQEGFDFFQLEDATWQVIKNPDGVLENGTGQPLPVDGDGVFKVVMEEVDEMPEDPPAKIIYKKSKWAALQKHCDEMEPGKVFRLAFKTKEMVANAKSAIKGHIKRTEQDYEIRFKVTEQGASESAYQFYLYMEKLSSDPIQGHLV